MGAGADGWVDDRLALLSDGGFAPADIARPVLLWHGAGDLLVPEGHFRRLAARVPRVRPVLAPDTGRFGAYTVLPDVLRWLCPPAL